MKIAFLNRGRETHPGGDIIQLDHTMDALRKLGVECVETGWDAKRISEENFDLCHMFHCNFDWSWGNYQAIHKANKPYVLTPIWYPGLLSGITKMQLSQMVILAKMVLPFSHKEGNEIRSELGWIPWVPVFNGTDTMFHSDEPNDTREGVLCVSARGESDKNVQMVRQICQELGLPFTVATGIPYPELPAIYKKHRVFVNASESERMSLTVGEALCANCRVIDSTGNRGAEWYGPDHVVVEPIKEVLHNKISLANYCWAWPDQPSRIAKTLTWEKSAQTLLDVYKWVLNNG